jgi:hypothetical protein
MKQYWLELVKETKKIDLTEQLILEVNELKRILASLVLKLKDRIKNKKIKAIKEIKS